MPRTLDPTTRAFLGDLERLAGLMPRDRLRRWQERVAAHSKRQTVGTELVAVAARLLRSKQEAVARLVCEVAWAALGDLRQLASSLEKAGADATLVARTTEKLVGRDWKDQTDPDLVLAPKGRASSRITGPVSTGGVRVGGSGSTGPLQRPRTGGRQ